MTSDQAHLLIGVGIGTSLSAMILVRRLTPQTKEGIFFWVALWAGLAAEAVGAFTRKWSSGDAVTWALLGAAFIFAYVRLSRPRPQQRIEHKQEIPVTRLKTQSRSLVPHYAKLPEKKYPRWGGDL
jgi:hypothetical protein